MCSLVLQVFVFAVFCAFELERGIRDREVMTRALAELVDNTIARGTVGLVPLLKREATPGTMGPWVCRFWE